MKHQQSYSELCLIYYNNMSNLRSVGWNKDKYAPFPFPILFVTAAGKEEF